MKIWFLTCENCEYAVVFANNETEAFEKVKARMKDIHNIEYWTIEEFTPESYDGVLCFY